MGYMHTSLLNSIMHAYSTYDADKNIIEVSDSIHQLLSHHVESISHAYLAD